MNDSKPTIVNYFPIIGIFLLIIAGIIVSTTIKTSANSPDKTNTPSVNQSEARVIEVEAGSFYFKPDIITVKKGEKVKLVIKSVSMMHDFVVDELNVRTPITKNGETNFVEFTPDKTGTFEAYCSVGQHRQNGQVGKLIVEE